MEMIPKALCAALLASSAFAASAATFVGDRTDFRDETIYFAMTTRFYDGDPQNNVYCWDGVNNINDPEWRGDFKGMIDKLDYIRRSDSRPSGSRPSWRTAQALTITVITRSTSRRSTTAMCRKTLTPQAPT